MNQKFKSEIIDAIMKEAVAPPKWEGTVKHMKEHKEITNPYALAWDMKNKGAKPHYTEKGTKKKKFK
jgi:hypothetical protein